MIDVGRTPSRPTIVLTETGALDPSGHTNPAGHASHVILPVDFVYRPTPHAKHVDDPEIAQKNMC